jgi:VWFA-related protein
MSPADHGVSNLGARNSYILPGEGRKKRADSRDVLIAPVGKQLERTAAVRLSATFLIALSAVAPLAARVPAVQERPTFKAGVDRVTVTAVVHKRNGQPVTGLRRDDFILLDDGRPSTILEFRSEPTPATVAVLVDLSGSMGVAAKLPAARGVASEIVAQLSPGVDRVGLFAFYTRVHELRPFEPAGDDLLEQFDIMRPFGSTSLFDAVADVGRRLAADGSTRRAVVALTDGGENSSRLSVAQVTRTASEIDVPVYIVVIVPPRDRESMSKDDSRLAAAALADGRLGNLAHWTGGEIFYASTDLRVGDAARQIVDELRHQYFLGFAPDAGRPGWHSIEVRTTKEDLIVRARSGYVAREE